MKNIFFISLFLMLTACADSTPHPIPDVGHAETGQPALHAVHNTQLQEQMNRMNSVMLERFMTEPELDAERHRYAQRMAKTAQNLSQTLDAIVASSATLKLNQNEEGTFQALIEKLRRQSVELQTQAEQKRLEAIPGTLEQINNTCTSCHVLFRKL